MRGNTDKPFAGAGTGIVSKECFRSSTQSALHGPVAVVLEADLAAEE